MKIFVFLLFLLFSFFIKAGDDVLKVAVFSGHTTLPEKDGCISASGEKEFLFNDEIVKRLGTAEEKDFKFIPVLASDNILLEDRIQKALDLGADFYIEIHHDSAPEEIINKLKEVRPQTKSVWSKVSGYSVFFSSQNPFSELSKSLGRTIAEWMKSAGFVPNPYQTIPVEGETKKIIDKEVGLYDNEFFVLKNSLIPAVIIEVGVIANPFEEKHLKKAETKTWTVRTIRKAVRAFVKEHKTSLLKIKEKMAEIQNEQETKRTN